MTSSQVTENLDQPRNRLYAVEAVEYITKKLKNSTNKKDKPKHRWSPARVALFEATLGTFIAKREALNDLTILSSSDLASITTSFEDLLLHQLQKAIRKPKKIKEHEKRISIVATVDALAAMNVDKIKLAAFANEAKDFVFVLNTVKHELGAQLGSFLAPHFYADGQAVGPKTRGNTRSISGRKSIVANIQTEICSEDQDAKLELLKTLCRTPNTPPSDLDQLLSIRCMIVACTGL